jgi:hypothetical protein
LADIYDSTARRIGDIFLSFLPSITVFVLVTPSPLPPTCQFFAIGFASDVIAALLSALAMARGTVSGQASVFIIVISTVAGAVISFLASSETMSEKRRDELVSKSDDQSWRV